MAGVTRLSRGMDYGPMRVGKAKRGPAVSTGIYGRRVSGTPIRGAVRVRGRRR